MSFHMFKSDVLEHGAIFACNFAHTCGVPGKVQALWLSRITLKAMQVAA